MSWIHGMLTAFLAPSDVEEEVEFEKLPDLDVNQYWTGEEALRRLDKSGDSRKLVFDWWGNPDRHRAAPFNYLSPNSTGCLTMIHGRPDVYSSGCPIIDRGISRDPLLPDSHRELYDWYKTDPPRFESGWNRCCQWQAAIGAGWTSPEDPTPPVRTAQ